MSDQDKIDGKALGLKWLSQREHSAKELGRKLAAKGLEAEEIARVLTELEKDGYQDDQRCLQILVRSLYIRGHGPLRIRHEAQAKGIKLEGLTPALAGYDFGEALQKVHDGKFGTAPPDSAKEQASRVRFLLQRGFAMEDINHLMRKLRRGSED